MTIKLPSIQTSISTRLMSLFFLVFFLLFSLLCCLIWWNFRNHLIETYKVFTREHVRKMGKSIDMLLTRSEGRLRSLKTVLETLELNPLEQEALLIQTTLEDSSVHYISIFDASGKEVATSEPDFKIELSRMQDAIAVCRDGTEYASEVFYNESHYPVIIRGIPIYQLGQLRYFLYAEMNLIGMWYLLDELNQQGVGEYFILSGKGLIMSYQNKQILMKHESNLSKEISEGALSSLLEPKIVTLSNHQKLLFSTCHIDGLGYYLVLQINLNIVLHQIKIMTSRVVIIATLILIFALIAVWRVSRRISKPILNLVENLDHIDQELFERSVLMESREDEVGILYREFYKMNEKVIRSKAREKLAAIGEAMMKVAHEIKNPLTAIKNFVTLHVENPANLEIFEKFKQAVPDEIKRIQNLFDDLSQMSLGKKLNLTKLSLVKTVDDALNLFDEECRFQHVEIDRVFPLGEIEVVGDVFKLKSVWVNLIKNAMEIMVDGGKLQIEITKDTKVSSMCRIFFRDTGTGLSDEILNNIFQPFFTTKESGMGLGLAICKGIIVQHGGELKARNLPDQTGAEFEIALPCV